MKKISIITPMYNSFWFMKKNLAVLEKQEDALTDLIIVDDCSKDDSFARAKEYAKESKIEIKVIKNEKNGGPGFSRNRGIEQATGDYVTFVDSDDYLADDFTKKLAPVMEKNFDCIIVDYLNVDENGETVSCGKSVETGITGSDIDGRIAFVYTNASTWGKIYRRESLINSGAKFGEYFRGEDMPFSKHAIAMSETVYYLEENLYMYVQRQTSLMHDDSLLDESNCQRSFAILKERLADKGFDEELVSIELREVLNNTLFIKLRKGAPRKEILSYIKNHYTKEHIKTKYFAGYPKHVKITSYLALYRCVFLLRLLSRYKEYIKRKRKQ